MQVGVSIQTDNYDSTTPLSFFLQAGCPSCHPTNSVKVLKAKKPEQKTAVKKLASIVQYKCVKWNRACKQGNRTQKTAVKTEKDAVRLPYTSLCSQALLGG